MPGIEKEVLGLLQKKYGCRVRLVAVLTYSIGHLDHTQKTLFGYALKGRPGRKGYLQLLKGQVVGRNNVLIPYANLDKMLDFFLTWKTSYTMRTMVEIKR